LSSYKLISLAGSAVIEAASELLSNIAKITVLTEFVADRDRP